MLENYEKLPNGVIKQIDVKEFNYGYEYSNHYNDLGELGKRMSYLRLGYVIGSIGHVPNSILDVGYGNGDFLNACKETVKKCYGHDVSDVYPVPSGVEYIDDIYDKEFDVVCFFDVLEHLEDIYEIKNLKAKYVVVSLPHCHYESDEWFANWKHRKPNEHLWHFNKESLINFMSEIGYTVINTSNVEDVIRKGVDSNPNILTAIFKR